MSKTALILEGGGMRGIYTAGVLDLFLQQGITFDAVYGVSAGACHATSFLSNQFHRAYDVCTQYLRDRNYCGVWPLLTTGNIIGVDLVYHQIPNKLNPFDYQAYDDNPCKLTAVLTNCVTGQAEYHQLNDLKTGLLSVQASASLPLVSRMVKINETPYLDGGVADPIPLKQAQKDGFEKCVVVQTRMENYRKTKSNSSMLVKAKYRHFPALVDSMETRYLRYNGTLDYIKAEQQAKNIFVIRPTKALLPKRIDREVQHLAQAYQVGYQDATDSLLSLQEYLK